MADDGPRPPVSRETSASPPPPLPVAAQIFRDRLPVAEAYAELLATAGLVRGLIGPREVPRLWERHLLNCAVVADALPAGARLADIGSGAGLPGLVLAIRRPDLSVTLVEPLLRRVTFLREAVDALALTNAAVQRARAEELHGHVRFSAVTARAVAPLSRLLDQTMPLVEPSGSLLAMKGSSAGAELADAVAGLARWDARAERLSLGEGLISPPATVVRVVASDRPQLRLPRTSGSTGSRRRPRRRRGHISDRGPNGDEGRH